MSRTTLIFSLSALMACGAEQAQPDSPDAGAADGTAQSDASSEDDAAVDMVPIEADLGCLNEAVPTTAPDTTVIEGLLFDASGLPVIRIAGASVQVRLRSDDALLAETSTNGDGEFGLTIDTFGVVQDIYVMFTKLGYMPSRWFPPALSEDNPDVAMFMVTDTGLDGWYAQAGAARDTSKGTVLALAWDCAREAVAGATLDVMPGGTGLAFWNPDDDQWDANMTASSNAYALSVNAAPGPNTVTAAIGGMTLPDESLNVAAGELTVVLIDPAN